MKQKHESFGLIKLSRVSSSRPMTLFGNSTQSNQAIRLVIEGAVAERELNELTVSSTRNTVVAVEMSLLQYSEVISSIGLGDGTPVTIRMIDNKHIEEPPYESNIEVFRKEYAQETAQLAREFNQMVENAETLLNKGGTVTKSQRQEILQSLADARLFLASKLPFMQESFHREMEKAVTEAKAEIHSTLVNKSSQLGINLEEKPYLLNNDGE